MSWWNGMGSGSMGSTSQNGGGGVWGWIRGAANKVGDVIEGAVKIPGVLDDVSDRISDAYVDIARDLQGSDRARRIEQELREQQARQAGGDIASFLSGSGGLLLVILVVVVLMRR